jgi:hypothetical protein
VKVEMEAAQDEKITCAWFNQDHTHCALGTTCGWRIFQAAPFSACLHSERSGGIRQIEMLFSSSLIALVGGGEHASDSPRRLRLFNTSTSSPVFELTFATPVLRILMNRTRLLVILEQSSHIFELSTMRMLTTLETVPNPRGLASLSVDAESSVCVLLPTATTPALGKVVVFDAAHIHPVCTVAAHRSALAAIALSPRGDLLATASEKGTVVRVHALPTAHLLHVFRRGAIRTTIFTLSFSAHAESAAQPPSDAFDASEGAGRGGDDDSIAGSRAPNADPTAHASLPPRTTSSSLPTSSLLVCTSATGTIHVWQVGGAMGEVRPTGGRLRSSRGSRGSHDGVDEVDTALQLRSASHRAPAAGGGIASWVSAAASSAQGERDVLRVKLRLPSGSRWCSAVIREGAMADGRAAMYVVTQSGAWYSYTLDVGRGSYTLQDERRLLPA